MTSHIRMVDVFRNRIEFTDQVCQPMFLGGGVPNQTIGTPDSSSFGLCRPVIQVKHNLAGIFFTTVFRPDLGPTQSPIQRVPGGSFPGGKAAGA